MCFVLTRNYLSTVDEDFKVPGTTSIIRKRSNYRVTGFDFSGNSVLTNTTTNEKITIPKKLKKLFVENIPDDKAFIGTPKSSVIGFYEGQKTNFTCWASALSNVIMTIQDEIFISELDIVKLLNATAFKGGPDAEEYLKAIEYVIREKDLPHRCDVKNTGTDKSWAEIFMHLKNGFPAICSVNRRSHVVIILGFTATKPYFVHYFEPTGGSYKKITLDEFRKFKSPDFAYILYR